jgi:hypothetical protein
MRTRRILVAAGVLLMGYAVAGALTDPDLSPFGVAVFLAGVLAGHDVVWMAVLLAAGAAIGRFVPPRRRPAVRTAAISAAAAGFVALPLVLGFGRSAENPSALPLPYGRNLALVLLLLAGAALLTMLPLPGRKQSERPGTAGSGDSGR